MSMNPRDEGFRWCEETRLTNPFDETRTITPLRVSGDIQSARNELEQMAYRFYRIKETKEDVNEHDLVLWYAGNIGNVLATRRLLCSVFGRDNRSELQPVNLVDIDEASRGDNCHVKAGLEYLEIRGAIRVTNGEVLIVDISILSDSAYF